MQPKPKDGIRSGLEHRDQSKAQYVDPSPLGHRKRARVLREAKDQAELAAEKRPRIQGRWLSEQRKASELPKLGGGQFGQDDEALVKKSKKKQAKDHKPEEKEAKEEDLNVAPGRKKAKRLAMLEARKGAQAAKAATHAQKAAEAAAAAVKGKAKTKDAELSKAAQELLAKTRRQTPADERRLLATVADRISGAPEKELDLFDIFFELHRSGLDPQVRLLALLSAVAVFQDLIPGYRVREPTEQEKAAQRSKPVLALQKYELSLLQTYRRLLPALEAGMKREPAALAPALGALVKVASDFNYRQRLLGTAIRHANSPEAAIRGPVIGSLQEMVEADQRLEASKEVVLAIGRLAQGAAAQTKKGPASNGQQSGLQPDLLKVLLKLSVGRAEEAAATGVTGDLTTADDDVKKGLAEASITHGVEHLRKAEAELLYEAFVVYLRILRQRHLHGRALLATILTGLAKWGQQVNLELLLEILVELKLTVQEAIQQFSELVALQGLNCALALLSGPSQALITDVTWLSDSMTAALNLALPSMYSTHSEGDEWPPKGIFQLQGEQVWTVQRELQDSLETDSVPVLVLRCLESALKCPQGYGRASDAALASLLEALFTLALTADQHVGLALLREASMLLRRQFKLHTLLDIDGGIFGLGGVTDRAVSVTWHLEMLALSIAPDLAKASKALPSSMPRRSVLISELFPIKEPRNWLASEFARHVAAVAAFQRPNQLRRKGFSSFSQEAELRAIIADS